MSQTYLPVIGPGSQPDESDGAQLDYMRMPSEMAVYSAPEVPEAEDVHGFSLGMDVLEQLLVQLQSYGNEVNKPIDLKALPQGDLNLVNQVLGEGEVSIVVEGEQKNMIQESVLAGVWRVQSTNASGAVLSDYIEVADIPGAVRHDSFNGCQTAVSHDPDDLLEGVMNAPPLLSEINDHISQGGVHVINLSLLPQSEADLAFLQDTLGGGGVVMLSRGYGNCRITSTGTKNVWWVQYFNSQDTIILNTLEVTDVPEVACAAGEDITDSAQRLNEILEVYR